jgi:RNA polymerase sigma-70 factor (ECF subfamily)
VFSRVTDSVAFRDVLASSASDPSQDAFASLFQHLGADKSRENLGAWLFRVAHNLVLKRRYRIRRELEDNAEAAIGDSVIDPASSAEDDLVRDQTQHRMMTDVEALREQDRRCLDLRAEGSRYLEIAELLNIRSGPCPFP